MPTCRVRCLGPGAEHFFDSRDKVRNRICPRCEAKANAAPPVLRDQPVSVRMD